MSWYDNLKSHPRTFAAQDRAMTKLVVEKDCADIHSLYYAMVDHACRLEDELNAIQSQLKEISLDLLDALSD